MIPCALNLLGLITCHLQKKWSKCAQHKSKFVKNDNFKMFDTQTWTPKQRCNQVLTSSKQRVPIIRQPPYPCICRTSSWKWKFGIWKPYYTSTWPIKSEMFKNGHIVGIKKGMISHKEDFNIDTSFALRYSCNNSSLASIFPLSMSCHWQTESDRIRYFSYVYCLHLRNLIL